MRQISPEIVTANLLFMVFWLVLVLFILVAGQYSHAIGSFRERMISKWKPAIIIAGLFVLGMGLGESEFFNPYVITVFCQALIGLGITSNIEGFQPLPVTNALVQRRQILRQVILMAVISVLVILPALLIGTIGLDIGQHLFGETNYLREAANTLPPNKWLSFFLLLSGSGIAEETPYRLVLLSFIWKVTKRKWLAIVLSALVFGAYHLTPLNGMYRIFWQFPVSQFIASTLIGLVWGYLFIRRGYETTVLGHTFSNWLPLMVFTG